MEVRITQVINEDKLFLTKLPTNYYISPEGLLGSNSNFSDIWSAGVILYMILSGDPPFNGENNSDINKNIEKLKYSFPESKWKNISNDVKDLISHILVPENERFTAKQILSHPWLQKTFEIPILDIEFNAHNFEKGSFTKKIFSNFIAIRLDENEINNLKNILSAIDMGKNRKINYQELKKGLIDLNSKNINENEINDLFDKNDVNNSDLIDYNEFIDAIIEKVIDLKEERLLERNFGFLW